MRIQRSRALASNQLQRLETRVPLLADDDVVVHGDTERARDLDDRLRHRNVGARGRRVAGGMVVQETTASIIVLVAFNFLSHVTALGTCIGVGTYGLSA